ncbi:MAG: tetratricopeptide repeat protein [Bacteroidia bacterium]|nr:tetratricopeptide repeat protein [Bacteroidia bacterium]MCF8445468.1 tetratricopeptide repeat protein [Bacteroidia bacterium]
MKTYKIKHIFTKIAILFLLILLNNSCYGQQADEELAAQFMGNKEYSKAADMYEKLLNKNSRSMYFYDNLLKCYILQNDYNSANKLTKKQSKREPSNYYFKVDQAYVSKLQGDLQKSKQQFQELVQTITPNENSIYELAKAFEKRNEKEFSIETYNKGRKILKSETLFANELGSLYGELKETNKMIEEFLNVLVNDPTFITEIQGYLQNTLESATDFELLKQALVKKSKQYPERTSFSEMLIWMHVQRNEYNLALIYAKSIDKKGKEDGRRLIELGFLASANEKYDDAIFIFQQVEALGKEKSYYSLARNSSLDALSKKVLSNNYTQENLLMLQKSYLEVLEEFGRIPSTANTLKNLANLQAFYLNDYENAIKNYEELITMARIDRHLQAQCKLELGDFYVLKGEVWDAMLLYGQVDKDFLEEPLGQEAKFRNARLSYYLGEFEWAKAQLDILKTATTQLIANNALELSLLIQDNTVDSILEPLQIFALADLNYFQKNDVVALQKLDSINLLFPKHRLSDDILFKKAEIYYRKKDYSVAANFFQRVVDEHGTDILGDNALYKLARINQYDLKNSETAKKLYEKFIDTYPGSFYLTDCRKQFRLLRGDLIN